MILTERNKMEEQDTTKKTTNKLRNGFRPSTLKSSYCRFFSDAILLVVSITLLSVAD